MPELRWRLTVGGPLGGAVWAMVQTAAAIQDQEIAVSRARDASHINRIANHPDVRPTVADVSVGEIDVTAAIKQPTTIALQGEFGAQVFYFIMPGVYEVHSLCLPEGRGRWMREFVRIALRTMFIQYPAWELVTRVPRGHLPARALTIANGFKVEFTRDDKCVFRGEPVEIDIYRLGIHDWANNSDWALEMGRIFHDQLHAEARRIGITEPAHPDDPQHNRIAGAAVEMARLGQVVKSMLFYNRWSILARHAQIGIVTEFPPTFKMDIGNMVIKPDGIEVTR